MSVNLASGLPAGTMAMVTVSFDLRDWSNNKDAYQGEVSFAVIGE